MTSPSEDRVEMPVLQTSSPCLLECVQMVCTDSNACHCFLDNSFRMTYSKPSLIFVYSIYISATGKRQSTPLWQTGRPCTNRDDTITIILDGGLGFILHSTTTMPDTWQSTNCAKSPRLPPV